MTSKWKCRYLVYGYYRDHTFMAKFDDDKQAEAYRDEMNANEKTRDPWFNFCYIEVQPL